MLARNRKTYAAGDFTRTKCQRLLVQALAKKILSQDAAQMPSTIAAAAKCFSTDMQLDQIVSLATSMQGMDTDAIYMAMAPSTTDMINEVSYTLTYVNQWKLIMQRADAGEDPTLDEQEQAICGTLTTKELSLDMEAGLPSDVQSALEEYWEEKAEKEKAEREAEIAKQKDALANQGGSSSSSSGTSSDSNSSNESGQSS